MVNPEHLVARGLRAYEVGRFVTASRIALLLIPIAALCLLESEGRHYRGYLKLAYLYGDAADVDARIETVRAVERELILSPDEQFRFHSGVPL